MQTNNLDTLRDAINLAYLAKEKDSINVLLSNLKEYDPVSIKKNATDLIGNVRKNENGQSLTEAFLHEYQLNSREGIILMEIAEALLRIPDTLTQDLFLQEKLTQAGWNEHLNNSKSLLVNLTTNALLLTGKLEQQLLPSGKKQLPFEKLFSRLSAPVIRNALRQAMHKLARQFVIEETISAAIKQTRGNPAYRYSFDMLGESALTAKDAQRYFQRYLDAINKLARDLQKDDIFSNHGISVKLSALCPRYEPLQHQRAIQEITAKLLYLAKQAKAAGISLTVDAEESERLEMSLDIFANVFRSPDLHHWSGLGLAVQAYQKRAIPVLHWLAALAESEHKKIPLRLVKGAYWDTEIKRAQENGLSHYPVFTHKTATDVSYLACATFILSRSKAFYAQFATHNAHTVTAIQVLAKQHQGYEFQRLHGMGEQLYEQIIKSSPEKYPCRIYAPVGSYQDLLPYLVRRLLENGANTSFINQIENPDINLERLVEDPVSRLQESSSGKSEKIVLPIHLYGKNRVNSHGINLNDQSCQNLLKNHLEQLNSETWQAAPLVNGNTLSGQEYTMVCPGNQQLCIGTVIHSDDQALSAALNSAENAFTHWRQTAVKTRAECLLKAADLMEKNRIQLVSLCIREGGRTIKDALSEVREAIDFCRYYAHMAQELSAHPDKLPGPTGEENLLYRYGRGIFVCISPWNFPIAIFTGQISAALVTGNTVLAKPARQTPLTAMFCIQLLHQAGIPVDVLHFIPGDGTLIGRTLLSDQRVAGVVFTGSTVTARLINQQLAKDHLAIVPLIAETGGQNIMIADSSAHAEQLVQDIIQSAFNSAGQRCSALRVLFLQQEVADLILDLLQGVMCQLIIGDPSCLETDIGPVIDKKAADLLTRHVKDMRNQAKILFQAKLDKTLQNGNYFPPTLIELTDLKQLGEEIFGPVLHVIRYKASELEQVISAINETGYGLTLGIQSRIESTIRTIQENAKVGNIYVNRNMIGAVVGVQPFGGMGLSGTGPKAGGPDYLRRFTVEQTLTINSAAVGGNTKLLAQNLR